MVIGAGGGGDPEVHEIEEMKKIEFFFELLMKYHTLKYELKAQFELLKHQLHKEILLLKNIHDKQ